MPQQPDQPDDAADNFLEQMADVVPISQDRAEPFKAKRKPKPLNLPVGDEAEQGLGDLNIETGDFLEFMKPGVRQRDFADLRRGVIPPEATLDLHGMRVADARQAFSRFMKHSTGVGYRCVRIIHGKGRGSAEGQPILKQKTHQWLLQVEAVLAFHTAPRWDGGTGAVYVMLSRRYGRIERF